jgi:hypothetical protein
MLVVLNIPNLKYNSQLTPDNQQFLNTYFTNTDLTWSSIISNLGSKANTADITKSLIGLGNVDNTSDLSKPVSTAVQSALDTKLFTSQFDSIPTQTSQ